MIGKVEAVSSVNLFHGNDQGLYACLAFQAVKDRIHNSYGIVGEDSVRIAYIACPVLQMNERNVFNLVFLGLGLHDCTPSQEKQER